MPEPVVVAFTPSDLERHVEELGGLLHACVHAGAGVSFILPFTTPEAEGFWTSKVLPQLRDGRGSLLVAKIDGRVAGCVQLDCDTPPNQRHRAEVRKLLVHPDLRRRGVARRLMIALEELARRQGRTLLTLDTRTGDKAEPLYSSLGYRTVGIIPGFARATADDRTEPTTVMYKELVGA